MAEATGKGTAKAVRHQADAAICALNRSSGSFYITFGNGKGGDKGLLVPEYLWYRLCESGG